MIFTPYRMERFKIFALNIMNFHQYLMARFLERRGWVVMYLDERSRCGGRCVIELYEQGRKK